MAKPFQIDVTDLVNLVEDDEVLTSRIRQAVVNLADDLNTEMINAGGEYTVEMHHLPGLDTMEFVPMEPAPNSAA